MGATACSALLLLLAAAAAALTAASSEQAGGGGDRYPEKDCLFACTREYEPVCGVDSQDMFKTFANKCFLNFYNCNNKNDETDYSPYGEGECSDYSRDTNEASPVASVRGE